MKGKTSVQLPLLLVHASVRVYFVKQCMIMYIYQYFPVYDAEQENDASSNKVTPSKVERLVNNSARCDQVRAPTRIVAVQSRNRNSKSRFPKIAFLHEETLLADLLLDHFFSEPFLSHSRELGRQLKKYPEPHHFRFEQLADGLGRIFQELGLYGKPFAALGVRP
jgi:hypothetical protein